MCYIFEMLMRSCEGNRTPDGARGSLNQKVGLWPPKVGKQRYNSITDQL